MKPFNESRLLHLLTKVLTVGCSGRLSSSENRLTILTNVMCFWGFISLAAVVPVLRKNNVPLSWFIGPYAFVWLISPFGLYWHYKGYHLLTRTAAVFVVNFIAWQAAILFGKSFNGYLTLFPGIVYCILAFSKAPPIYRWGLLTMTLLGLPGIDWLSHGGYIPITDLDSKNFSSSVLLVDTFFVSGFLAIVVLIEKIFYDKYERELQELNENLEETVEKRTAMLVQAKEESMQAQLIKSQFVANTSHELRTPVQGIIGFIEMSKRRLLKMSGLNPQNIEFQNKSLNSLEAADQASQRLLSLVDRLLKITQSGSSGLIPRGSEFNVLDVLQETLAEILPKAQDKKMKFEIQNNFSQERAFTDKTMFQQVLSSLLDNAIRYGQRETVVFIKIYDTSDTYEISISNRGIGIDAEDRDRIFEPFVQGSRTDATTGGTGLGLTLCKKFSAAIGGDVILIDPSEENTEFLFKFPRQLGEAKI